jgi:hypothetical protein
MLKICTGAEAWSRMSASQLVDAGRLKGAQGLAPDFTDAAGRPQVADDADLCRPAGRQVGQPGHRMEPAHARRRRLNQLEVQA